MTKGKKIVSRSNDSTSENIRKVLCFGRGDGDQTEDVYAINLDALEPIIEDISVVSNLAQPVQISIVKTIVLSLHSRHTLFLLAVHLQTYQSL